MELNLGEEFFINTCRSFDFLRLLGYDGANFCIIGRESWVSFLNPRTHIKIIVLMEEPWVLNVRFEKKKFSGILRFNLNDYYKKLGVTYLEKTNDVKTIASFIEKNLMPIVKGEKWIDAFEKN
jgi:hypothetical protein